mmetsp:Transcript_31632/g.68288  ORF Transcript_31632/g.68288 Transcript_31632/m.68288 type:complete len:152 (+) Transcript_31632:35-490(+)
MPLCDTMTLAVYIWDIAMSNNVHSFFKHVRINFIEIARKYLKPTPIFLLEDDVTNMLTTPILSSFSQLSIQFINSESFDRPNPQRKRKDTTPIRFHRITLPATQLQRKHKTHILHTRRINLSIRLNRTPLQRRDQISQTYNRRILHPVLRG